MIKIIAVGNRLMQDDGVAIAVLEHIMGRLETTGMEVILGETDAHFCFYQVREDDFVILVDAEDTEAGPGSLHVYELQGAAFAHCGAWPHDMGFLELMRLYKKPLKGYLIGIGIARAGFGTELSDVLKSRFDGICIEVERLILEIAKEAQNA